jgi:hypothetical protein
MGWRSPTLDRSGFAGPNIFLLPRAAFGKGPSMHNEQKVSDMAVEVLAQQTRTRAERTGEPFEGALKSQEKSTSAKSRLPREGVAPTRASREEGYERTQEWWEGYDPGMDVNF